MTPASSRPFAAPGGSGPGSLALDFLHTLRSTRAGRTDLIHAPQDLSAWLADRVDGAARLLSTSEAAVLAVEARRLRADIGALVEAHHEGREIPDWARAGLDRVLAAAHWSRRLERTREGLRIVERAEGSSPLRALAPVALAAVRLITEVPQGRLRPCARSRCGTWFIDTSKGGRRRWCSMARCGNREKAAAFRAKVARG
jgi:predicted RNA-binding Zn ribbon-like protein